eukprot:1921657-Rhodomonas_salina.1
MWGEVVGSRGGLRGVGRSDRESRCSSLPALEGRGQLGLEEVHRIGEEWPGASPRLARKSVKDWRGHYDPGSVGSPGI